MKWRFTPVRFLFIISLLHHSGCFFYFRCMRCCRKGEMRQYLFVVLPFLFYIKSGFLRICFHITISALITVSVSINTFLFSISRITFCAFGKYCRLLGLVTICRKGSKIFTKTSVARVSEPFAMTESFKLNTGLRKRDFFLLFSSLL